jgi:hypothetical protein
VQTLDAIADCAQTLRHAALLTALNARTCEGEAAAHADNDTDAPTRASAVYVALDCRSTSTDAALRALPSHVKRRFRFDTLHLGVQVMRLLCLMMSDACRLLQPH